MPYHDRNWGRRFGLRWGASGMKSFDCSGCIWRVMSENGILMKRTTARKFYMILPAVPETEKWNFGTWCSSTT
jgi:cell wall-associated NlpC family hydrolase